MAHGDRLARLLLIVAVLASGGGAQKGTAPRGLYHYPANYHGDLFTGEVLRTDDKHLILEYKGASRSEIFTGTIEAPCMARLKADPHQVKELRLSTIPNRTLVTAFYNSRDKNQTGAKDNLVLAIRFDRWKGREFTNPRRPVIPCSKSNGSDFK